MSHKLKTLLDLGHPMFEVGLDMLEKSTGNAGIDVRLIADITHKAHAIMRSLSLDIKDTTATELYYALNAAATRDDFEELFAASDYVLIDLKSELVSFNLIDIVENYHHSLPFANRLINHGRRSLRGEIIGRYNDHARTNEASVREIAKNIGLLPKDDE